MYDLIVFLDENIVYNLAYADVISEEQKTQIKDAEKEISDGESEIAKNEKKLW